MKKYLQLTLALIAFSFASFAQPGAVDLSFNPTDTVLGIGANGIIRTTSIQSDGKIIIGGDFTSFTGITRNYIARLNTDGTLDGTFNPGTGTNGVVYTTSIQNDGKIIIGGNFTSFNGIAIKSIARLNTDGTLDNTFNPIFLDSAVYSTSIQSDGKIIVGGDFMIYLDMSPYFQNRVTRLNIDGTLDNTFIASNGNGASGIVRTINIQSNGKIIIGGDFVDVNGTSRNRIARINTNGTLDTTFNPGTGANNSVYSTSIQSDGKIIIGGYFTSFNGTAKKYITRLNADGTLDSSFNSGTGADNYVLTTSFQNDGKIIMGGWFTTYNSNIRNYIARLNSDGTLDSSFNSGTSQYGTVYTSKIQTNGKIIIGGNFGSYNGCFRGRMARINIDGEIDYPFNSGTAADNFVRASSIQSDDKIIIGGDFTSYFGVPRNKIARLNADGTLDTSFNPGTGANGPIYKIAIQNDGKIIIGGDFTSYNGITINRIARLNVNGTLDTSFNPGTGANDYVYTISIQGDGKIIIGGNFDTYNGIVKESLARINTDGTLDNTFYNPQYYINGGILTTSIQSDGKIIIGGSFSNINNISRNRIARLNTDGTLDNSFNVNANQSLGVSTFSIQNDGKIIIGGGGSNNIVRLNTNLSLDTTFNPGTGINNNGGGEIYNISIQNDGKIIISGYFTSYNGISRNNIARLNTDGSLDTTFNVGIGTNNGIRTTSIQSDGKIIIGGMFNSYNGTVRNRIARINGGTLLSNSNFEKDDIVIYPNPSKGVFTINLNDSFEGKQIEVYSIFGQKIYTGIITSNDKTLDISSEPTGVYLYKIYGGNDIKSGKLIVE
jgi:uncharacterized delta-60 repeat protein